MRTSSRTNRGDGRKTIDDRKSHRGCVAGRRAMTRISKRRRNDTKGKGCGGEGELDGEDERIEARENRREKR